MKNTFEDLLRIKLGIYKSAFLPHYNDITDFLLTITLKQGFGLRFYIIYSWEKWPEIVRFSGNYFVVYDQYFGQCCARINRNVMSFRSRSEALSFAFRMIAHRLFKLNNITEAVKHIMASSALKSTTEPKFTESEYARGIATLIQEFYAISHEVYHFILNNNSYLHADVKTRITDMCRNRRLDLHSFKYYENLGADSKEKITTEISRVLNSDNFHHELCCDYMSATITIIYAANLKSSFSLVARAVDLFFYYIRFMKDCDFIARELPQISKERLLFSTVRMQLRHHMVRKILFNLHSNLGSFIGGRYKFWPDANTLAGIFDKNTEDFFSLFYDRLFHYAESEMQQQEIIPASIDIAPIVQQIEDAVL